MKVLILAGPFLVLLAVLIWVLFGNTHPAPAAPPVTVPAGSVPNAQGTAGARDH